MVTYSRWTVWASILACIVAVALSLPNVLPQGVRDALPDWLPKKTLNLGLDLQGGSYLLLEADVNAVYRERLETTRDDIRQALRSADIGYTGLVIQGADAVEVKIRDAAKIEEAAAKLQVLIVSLCCVWAGI